MTARYDHLKFSFSEADLVGLRYVANGNRHVDNRDSCVCDDIMCPQRDPNLIMAPTYGYGPVNRRCAVSHQSRGTIYYCNKILKDDRCAEHGQQDETEEGQLLAAARLGTCRWVKLPGRKTENDSNSPNAVIPRIVDQPAPVPNEQAAVWGLVLKDMIDRDAVGRERYGTPLQPHNGRDALVDAYQEALDLVVYLRQVIYERDNAGNGILTLPSELM